MSDLQREKTILHAETSGFRVLRLASPVLTLFATIVVGRMLDVLPDSLTASVTSPLAASILLGLSFFPFGVYMLLGGLVRWAETRESKFWPMVKAHVFTEENNSVVQWVSYWYVVNGTRYESRFAPLSWMAQFPPGTEINVRFDPENPETAVLATHDTMMKFNIRFGIFLMLAPFAIAWLLMWWANR
jgi:hypothetical protein